jgi:tetratricopeptide (TPR) repeat protein
VDAQALTAEGERQLPGSAEDELAGRKSYAKAAETFMKAIRAGQTARSWNGLGAAYFLFVKGNVVPYIGQNHWMLTNLFDKSGRLSPTVRQFARGLVDKTHLDGLEKCLDFAEHCFNRAIEFEAGNPGPARYWRALVYRGQGRIEQAIGDLQIASKNPSPWRDGAIESLTELNDFNWNSINRPEIPAGGAAASPAHEFFGGTMRRLLALIDSVATEPPSPASITPKAPPPAPPPRSSTPEPVPKKPWWKFW